MNTSHQNARTTVHNRELKDARLAQGRPIAQIAEELGVSCRSVYKWLCRRREGGAAALANRSSRPRLHGAAIAARMPDFGATSPLICGANTA